jgi:hypothetical protein
VDGFENLNVGDTASFDIEGQAAGIEQREQFLVLKIPNISSVDNGKLMFAQLAVALVRLSAETGAALQFPNYLVDIARANDPNLRFREALPESEYPADWNKREDGTRTDGGIFAVDACILPEHERIWEYPNSFGKIVRLFNFSHLSKRMSGVRLVAHDVANDNSICLASAALWAACAQYDRRIAFILLVTTIEILASREKVPTWVTVELEIIISEIRDFIQSKSNVVPEQMLEKFSRKFEEIGITTIADRIRGLVLRSFGHLDANEQSAKDLIKEVNATDQNFFAPRLQTKTRDSDLLLRLHWTKVCGT